MIKAIEREYNFFKENSHLEFLKNAAKKALTHWKILKQKIPESVEKEIEEMINGNKWYTTIELDKKYIIVWQIDSSLIVELKI